MFSLTTTFLEMELPQTGDLLARAQKGDAGAFCEICRLHEARLLRQAMTLCGNPSLAEELAQDTLVEAWKSLRRFNGRCQFFTWLCAILLHRFHNALRKKQSAAFSALASDVGKAALNSLQNLADESCAPDRAAEIGEQAARIKQSLDRLPAKHQQVIYLRFYVGDSLEGIAAALGCSPGTVKSRLHYALDRLRTTPGMNAPFMAPQTEGQGI